MCVCVVSNCCLHYVAFQASILENVSTRFLLDKIYTNTGPILIAMNPFKWLPLYGDDVKMMYRHRPHGALPPHCFAEVRWYRPTCLSCPHQPSPS